MTNFLRSDVPISSVPVVFLARLRKGKKQKVCAIFPTIPGKTHLTWCALYSGGQLREREFYDCIRKHRIATPEEYSPLQLELRELGYRLEVQRWPTIKMHEEREAKAQQIRINRKNAKEST